MITTIYNIIVKRVNVNIIDVRGIILPLKKKPASADVMATKKVLKKAIIDDDEPLKEWLRVMASAKNIFIKVAEPILRVSILAVMKIGVVRKYVAIFSIILPRISIKKPNALVLAREKIAIK